MEIELTINPGKGDLDVIKAGMRAYEVSRSPGLSDEAEDIHVAFIARNDEGVVCGGLNASIFCNGLEIDVLWVDEHFRHQKIATQLITMAEDFARDKGAVIAYLKTVDAGPFYESCGY